MSKAAQAYDTNRLQELGKRHQRLVAQLAEVDAALDTEILQAAQAGVPQVDIIRWTGLARESVRRKSMTPEQNESERAKRRAKGIAAAS